MKLLKSFQRSRDSSLAAEGRLSWALLFTETRPFALWPI